LNSRARKETGSTLQIIPALYTLVKPCICLRVSRRLQPRGFRFFFSRSRSIAISSFLKWLPTKDRISLPWSIRPNHFTLRFQGCGIHHHFYVN
jgi:hypothetical protein